MQTSPYFTQASDTYFSLHAALTQVHHPSVNPWKQLVPLFKLYTSLWSVCQILPKNIGKRAYKKSGIWHKTTKRKMSNVHRTTPPFLNIFPGHCKAEEQASVWSGVLETEKNKLLNTSQKQRQVSLLKVTHKNRNKWKKKKNTRILALTRCLLDWAKINKQRKCRQMTGKSRLIIFHQPVLFLFPLIVKKTKQRPRDDPKTVSQSVPMFPCSIHREHVQRRNEGTSVVASVLPGSTFTVSAVSRASGGRRKGNRTEWS